MGFVLFIFPDVRTARVEIAYGLEGMFPDARVPSCWRRDSYRISGAETYEGGLDAFLKKRA